MWQYIMSTVGLCVGFGAFWRFPYLVYTNGGGVFLIPYTIAMIFLGVPLLYLETAIGQMHRMSLPFIFSRIHPSLKIVGLGMMTAGFHLILNCNILITYSYAFLFTSFQSPLPFAEESITENRYFREDVLHQSESISHFEAINPYLFIIYIGSLCVCHFIVKDGAKTSGKIVTITASMPFAILSVLILRGLFLEGAMEGISYLFKPKWS